VIIVLDFCRTTLLARRKLLSFNEEGTIALPRARISPFSTLIYVLLLPNLRLSLTITLIYNSLT